MVKPVYNLPEDERDDGSAARHWLAALPDQYPDSDRSRIAQACDVLVRCRGNQTLETGESQVRHLLSTTDILVQLRMDAETLVASLLNGCLSQGKISAEQVGERFGPRIARMVADLAHIDQIANVDAVISAKDQDQHEENLRRLLLGIAEDVRVVLVVLAERLHLMRSIKELEEKRRSKIARDTRHVYAPLANRLGMWQIKWELEDLSLRYLEPAEYKRIAKLLDGRRAEREDFIAGVIARLQEKLAEAGVAAEISGRPKHIYSIWSKMQRKKVDIEQIFDLRAVRIMVDDIASCYAALGIVHGLWKHIPEEFDDYIATPKGNLYQSLHTAVVGPQDKPLEVQIRTRDMHRHAELGVAAHWAYKESKGHDTALQRRVVWMRAWLEHKGEGKESADFAKRFKAQLESPHIYLLTPQSKVIELPKGATPVDFAYAIHSEVGNRCRGARVNGRIVPLTQPLESGQTVEILTQKNASPSRDWLSPHHGYITTSKARNRVRQWFKQLDQERYVSEGKGLLDKELARLGIEAKPNLDEIGHRFNLHRGNDLLAALGRGELTPGQVARLVGEPRAERREETEETTRRKKATAANQRRGARAEVVIEGVDGLMTHMAHCCKPVPYDRITGFVTRGRGVTIHRQDCSNVTKMPETEKARLIDVRWADQTADAAYPVDLMVLAADRKGLLRDVSSVFSDEDVDVLGVHTASDRQTDRATMRFTVEVKNKDQLDHVVVKLGQIPDVLDVRRPH